MSALGGLGGGKIYLSIMAVLNPANNKKAGAFVKRVPEGTEGAVARKLEKGPNAGGTIHELYYGSVKGTITDIKGVKKDFGKMWEVELMTEDGDMTLTLPLSGGQTRGILWRLGNADLLREIVFLAGFDPDKGKNGSVFTYIQQDGKTIPQVWTKDLPVGMPEMEQKEVKGDLVWDDTKQIKFFHAYLEKEILPNLDIPQTAVERNLGLLEANAKVAEEVVVEEEEDDDLPF